jgi:site-specific recombinase XerD
MKAHVSQPRSARGSDYERHAAARVADLPLPVDSRWLASTRGWLGQYTVATQRKYVAVVTDFLNWCNERDLTPANATAEYVAKHLATITADRDLSIRSQNAILSALSSWYRQLHHDDLVCANPAGPVPRFHGDPPALLDPLTDDQRTRFLAAAAIPGPRRRQTRRDLALLTLLASVELPITKVLELRIDQIQTFDGVLHVDMQHKGTGTRIALPSASVAALNAYLAERGERTGVAVEGLRGWLFTTAAGNAIDEPSVSRLIHRVALRAGLPQWSTLSAGQLCGKPRRRALRSLG